MHNYELIYATLAGVNATIFAILGGYLLSFSRQAKHGAVRSTERLRELSRMLEFASNDLADMKERVANAPNPRAVPDLASDARKTRQTQALLNDEHANAGNERSAWLQDVKISIWGTRVLWMLAVFGVLLPLAALGANEDREAVVKSIVTASFLCIAGLMYFADRAFSLSRIVSIAIPDKESGRTITPVFKTWEEFLGTKADPKAVGLLVALGVITVGLLAWMWTA